MRGVAKHSDLFARIQKRLGRVQSHLGIDRENRQQALGSGLSRFAIEVPGEHHQRNVAIERAELLSIHRQLILSRDRANKTLVEIRKEGAVFLAKAGEQRPIKVPARKALQIGALNHVASPGLLLAKSLYRKGVVQHLVRDIEIGGEEILGEENFRTGIIHMSVAILGKFFPQAQFNTNEVVDRIHEFMSAETAIALALSLWLSRCQIIEHGVAFCRRRLSFLGRGHSTCDQILKRQRPICLRPRQRRAKVESAFLRVLVVAVHAELGKVSGVASRGGILGDYAADNRHQHTQHRSFRFRDHWPLPVPDIPAYTWSERQAGMSWNPVTRLSFFRAF